MSSTNANHQKGAGNCKSTLDKKNQMINWFFDYAKRIDSKKIDEGMIPPYIVNDLGRNGFFGMGIPKKYGGVDLGVADTLEILEMIAAKDMSVAILILDSLLSAFSINNYANKTIKETYLPDMAQGRILSALGITESVAGSNPRAMETKAEMDEAGNWILNGQKRWVGYASWAGFITIYAQTYVDDRAVGISGFFVPIETEGLEIKEEAITMGIKGFPKHTVNLNKVKIPKENILGLAGKGMESAQSTFMFVRLCMGALCLGAIKKLIQISTTYAFNRTIATGSLLDNPVSRITLTNLINGATTLETLVKVISQQLDNNMEVPEPAFIVAKTLGGELLSITADKSIQILGARGYEETNMVAQMYRDGRPFRIFEGPTEVLINYLGTQAYFDTGEVYLLLENNFKNKVAAKQLRLFVKEIKEKYEQDLIFGEKDTQIWVYSVIGEIAQWMILSTVIEYAAKPDLKSAKHWADAKLVEVMSYYQQKTAAEKTLLSSKKIIETVKSYEGVVGSLESNRLGNQQQPDALVLSAIPNIVLSDADRQKVLFDWNNTTSQERHPSLLELLSNSLKNFSSNIAISEKEKTITYAELDKLSDYLAALLQEKGVSSGDLVGLACERSIDMMVGIISILKLGAGYVPLDKAFPDQRNKTIIKETELSFVLTQSTFGKLPISKKQLIFIDKQLEQTRKKPVLLENYTFQRKVFSSEKTAYVIFTSGSTGVPKGVLISHQAVANFTLSAVKKYQITEKDRVLQFASLSFDAAIEEIFPTLISGGTLVLRTEAMLNSYSEFLLQCHQYDITVLNLPTEFWTNLTMDANLPSDSVHLPDNLRTVIIGGDKLSLKALKYWDKLATKDIDLWDTYGPTEATVVAISKLLRSPKLNRFSDDKEVLTIGKPDENVCVYVVDEQLNPMPIGQQGELLIGGANLGKYLNQPELNEEKFIDNPFITEEEHLNNFNQKLYRTGDLVKYQPNGELLFIGRIDNQIKIRGFRVELGEIEAAINAHPDVKETVVLAHQRNGFKEVLAAVIFHEKELDMSTQLSTYLESELPKYMLPAHSVPFTAFPMTIGKKVDRKAVLQEILQNTDRELMFSEATDTLSQLINIWQEVLSVSVDKSSNFFNEGGHSLTVMQVIGKINNTLKVSISAREFFQNATIKELTNLVENKKNLQTQPVVSSDTDSLKSSSENKNEQLIIEYGLSKPQTQYYIHDLLHTDFPLYNEPFMLTTQQSIHKEDLELALKQLISRHEMLRTSFHQSEQGLYQKCHDQVSFVVDYFDLSQKDHKKIPGILQKEADQQLKRLFDLETPCQMRCSLFKIGAHDYRIFFVVHHLIMDGISLYTIFLPELELLLNGQMQQLEPLSCATKYRNFAEVNFSITAQKEAYWQKIIGKHNTLVLPYDTKIETPSPAGAQMVKKIPSSGIKVISQRIGVSRFNILSTALNILLGHYTQKETISLGTIFNNRPSEMTNTMGVFSNTAVIQTDYNSNLSIKEYVFQVQDAFLDAMEYAIPYEALVKLGRSKQIENLIQVAIIYEPLYQENYSFGLDMHMAHSGTAKFDILFRFEEQDKDTTLLRVEYKTDLFTSSTIQRMMLHFKNILASMEEDIHQPIGRIDFRTAQESQILKGKQREFPMFSCPKLFEQQAAKTPRDVAISFGEEALTYQELNKLSNQIAYFLKETGVEKGNLVGLYLPRSIHQIATVIAILKLGAVFVPLDPAYPKKRLEFIVEQTGMNNLITDSTLPPLVINMPSAIYINQHLATIKLQKEDNPAISVSLDSLAYITFTSGVTGKPKGAKVSHQPLSNLIQWQIGRSALQHRTIQFTPLSFDVSFQEIFSTLASGGTLVLVTDEVRKNPVDLIDFITEHKITRIFLPFVALKQIAEAVHLEMAKAPHSLVEIITAGEQLKTTKAIQSLFRQLLNCSLDNQYGPCETHVVTAGKLDGENLQNWAVLPSIGQPIANMDLKVLNKEGFPVAANIEGELYIGIHCKDYGYFQNELETNKKFKKIGEKMYYRSGDIIRFDINGDIHWLGRADNQLKVRGYRIETGEVESVLINNSSIRQAVVTTIEQSNEKVLVAYLQLSTDTLSEGESSASFYAELKRRMSAQLPAYMIPVHFKQVVEFDLTPSGKVTRESLPPFDLSAVLDKQKATVSAVNNTSLLASVSNLEEEIMELFTQILELDSTNISTNSNFFDLGGSSLNGFLLVSKISKRFSTKLDPSVLMNHPTPSLLADTLRNSSNVTLSSLVEIRNGGDLPPLFLVPGSGGTLIPFEHLINQLPADRSIYGFVHPRLRGNEVDCSTINDLAAYYVYCIEQEKSYKTCYIVGHCFGGAVAYEMCQILARKDATAIPIIIDTPIPQESTRHLPAKDWIYAQWVAISGEVLAENAGHPISVIEEMKQMEDEVALLYLKNTLVKAGLYAADNDVQQLKLIVDMHRELDLSFMNYQPQKTKRALYLLRAKEWTEMDKLGILASGNNHPHWGWEDIADTIYCREVSGDHNTMLEEDNVSDIIQFLADCFVKNDLLLADEIKN